MKREQLIIKSFLFTSLALGFLTLFTAYLPGKFDSPKPKVAPERVPLPASPSLVLAEAPPETPGVQAPGVQGTGEQVHGAPPFFSEFKPDPLFAKGSAILSSPNSQGVYPLLPYEPLPPTPMRSRYLFNVASDVKIPFEFWRNVYARYNSNHSIFHDARHLDILYGVVDFTSLMDDLTLSEEKKRTERAQIEEAKREEIAKVLTALETQPLKAGATELEKRIFAHFEKKREAAKFRKATDRIRMQWGQKDRFQDAILRASAYMPLMERIFEAHGVPKEITRLVYVESMFQIQARSKAGAVGPWQFMPGTARKYLVMNEWMDERIDPLRSATAAAQLLKRQYEELATWPLAINAYNTGMLRMLKAIRQLQTRNIGTIIHYFRDAGYQFASRNFYPEFLAALEVADYHRDYFSNLVLAGPLEFDEVQMRQPWSPYELAQYTAIDLESFKLLNPAFQPAVWNPHYYLPAALSVRVPKGLGSQVHLAMNQLQEREASVFWHIVGKGERLKDIAGRHQLTVDRLKEVNGLMGERLRPGQILRIPPKEELVLEEKP